jgi:hypothetical protein
MEHPGYENNELESMVQQKAKLICSRQLKHYVAVELVHDECEMQQGLRDRIQDEHAIKGSGKFLIQIVDLSATLT